MNFRKGAKRYNWKEIGFILTASIVPIANFLVFYVYLNMDSFLLAFQTTKGLEVTWGFENFKTVFQMFANNADGNMGDLMLALKNTTIWFFVGVFLYIPQMLTTYFVFKKVKGFKFIAFMSLLPTLLPASAFVGFVKYIIAPEGALGYYYETKLNQFAPILLKDPMFANKVMIVYVVWCTMGVSLLWNGAMNNISSEVLEAGKIDGTTWISELWFIIIPMIFPTISVSLMGTAAGLLGATGPILIFTQGNYGTTTLNYWIFSQVKFSSNYELSATLGFLMSCVSIPLVFLVRKITEKVEVY